LKTTTPDAARFIPLATSLAEQVHHEIAPQVELDQIKEWSRSALEHAVVEYRSRQGATLRTYLSYKILAGIYNALSRTQWATIEDANRYKFAKKSNELMMHFATSAEGAVQRSIRLEQEEMTHLLRLLVVTGLLIYKDVPRGEIQKAWNAALEALTDSQRRFLTEYYDNDLNLEEASGRTSAEGFRFQWKILESLDSRIKHVGS
jgi:DNA-directed RNA polymerase specialized sigma subunit